MTFDELNINTPLYNALSDMDFIYPTPIQKQVFSPIMSGKDIVGIAQTGTGKTFAYLLPLLRLHKFSKETHPRILIIVPTRELVVQLVNEIEKLAKYMNIRFGGVYGGTSMKTQKKLVYAGLDILVATPGRLLDLALTGVLRLSMVKKLIIDEVDEMLNLGFRPQLSRVMDLLPQKRQNLMFSATLSVDVKNFINSYFLNPHIIEIEKQGTPLKNISQSAYLVPNFQTKMNLMKLLIPNEDFTKALIFIKSKKLADKLFEEVKDILPGKIGIIHSNKSQSFRLRSIENFNNGNYSILLATDIIARGLDISEVSHVINFDLPIVASDYIHRIGRTGRADKKGEAINFISELDEQYRIEIEELMKMQIPELPLPENLEISDIFTPEEKPVLYDKNYIDAPTLKNSQGAFHTKSEKNMQRNSGSPSRKRKKHKRPIKRSSKK